MRQEGSVPGSGEGQSRLAEVDLRLEALAPTLDRATLDMSMLSLEVTRAAANANSPLAAADGACELAARLTRQIGALEAAISQVVRGIRS